MIRHAKKRAKLPVSDKIYYAFAYTYTILLTAIVLYPLILTLSSSFSSGVAVSTGKVILWPVNPTLIGYRKVFEYQKVWIGYRNTIFYTGVGTLINVAFTLIAAYPLARKNLPDRKFITFLFTFTMLFSGGMIPSYLLISNLGILNTVWTMLLPGAIGVTQLIVTRTFLSRGIPDGMLEAAQIDGCSDFRFFFEFVLPLSKAVIAVIALQYAIGHWNSYFNAFLYLSDKNLYPLQIFLREILIMNQVAESASGMQADMIAEQQGVADILKYALIVVSTAPILTIYPFVQKYFVQGVMIGSLKE